MVIEPSVGPIRSKICWTKDGSVSLLPSQSIVSLRDGSGAEGDSTGAGVGAGVAIVVGEFEFDGCELVGCDSLSDDDCDCWDERLVRRVDLCGAVFFVVLGVVVLPVPP